MSNSKFAYCSHLTEQSPLDQYYDAEFDLGNGTILLVCRDCGGTILLVCRDCGGSIQARVLGTLVQRTVRESITGTRQFGITRRAWIPIEYKSVPKA